MPVCRFLGQLISLAEQTSGILDLSIGWLAVNVQPILGISDFLTFGRSSVTAAYLCRNSVAMNEEVHYIYYIQVNNAGCMVNERTVTSDGLEMNFATNTLGNF